jgi:hypothetical protein
VARYYIVSGSYAYVKAVGAMSFDYGACITFELLDDYMRHGKTRLFNRFEIYRYARHMGHNNWYILEYKK